MSIVIHEYNTKISMWLLCVTFLQDSKKFQKLTDLPKTSRPGDSSSFRPEQSSGPSASIRPSRVNVIKLFSSSLVLWSYQRVYP